MSPAAAAAVDRRLVAVPCPPSRVVRLKCGRRVAYGEYGSPTGGRVVVYHHGLPSCHREAETLLPALACRPDVRVVAFDRPGIGESDPSASAGYGEWARDLSACLDALGVGRFALAGTSAGTPYMLATAAVLRGRVTAVSVAVPVSSLAERGGTPANGVGPRLARAAALAPNATRLGFLAVARRVGQRPEVAPRYLGPLTTADEQLVRDPAALDLVASFMGATARDGGRRLVAEMGQLTEPWCVRLADVVAPVTFFLGGQDRHWPAELSAGMARRVPGAVVREYPGESHFSLPIRHAGDVLAAAIG